MDGEEEAELGNPKMIRTTPLKPAAALLRLTTANLVSHLVASAFVILPTTINTWNRHVHTFDFYSLLLGEFIIADLW